MKARKPANTLKLIVVDDDVEVCKSLVAVLATYGFTTVSLHKADDLLRHLEKINPDCILLDLRMPGIDGMEALKILSSLPMPPPVIMLSAHGDIAAAVEAMRNGAADFIEKPFDDETLFAKITDAVTGHRKQHRPHSLISTLSPRETQVAQLVAKGYTTLAIADQLGLSARTVDHHRAKILAKMEATSLPQLISRLIAAGLDK